MRANPVPVMPEKKKVGGRKINRQKRNYLVYQLFTRRDIQECMELLEQVLRDYGEYHEYANFIKALLLRVRGSISQSLDIFKKCHYWNEGNVEFHKQICKNLLMLGKLKASIEVSNEALKLAPRDWEIHYTKGMAYFNVKEYDTALESFKTACNLSKHESTFLQLGRTYEVLGDLRKAIEIYNEGLQYSIENQELLTSMGLLFIKLGDTVNALQRLTKSTEASPNNFRSYLAIGSIIQDRSDIDAALTKYRIACAQNPNSAQLWNNIGLCFYSSGKYVAAISCLKKAQYLDPFEWTIAFNLGILHFGTSQYASAFHYFSMAINLNPGFAQSYLYLGLVLNRLDDFKNACAAFERAIEIEKCSPLPDFMRMIHFP